MDQKPFQMLKTLQQENEELKRTKKRLEYQIQEMVAKSAQRSAEVDKKVSELEIRIRDLEYENRELKADQRANKRKFMEEQTPSLAHPSVTVDLDNDDEEIQENLLEALPSQEQMQNFDQQPQQQQHNGFPYSCPICHKSYIQEKRLHTHMAKVHGSRQSPVMSLNTTQQKQQQLAAVARQEDQKVYICNIKDCRYRTTFYPVMVRHKKSHTLPSIKCEFYGCDYDTKSRKRYMNHMQSKHGANLEHSAGIPGFESDDEQFSVYDDEAISSSMQETFSGH